MTLVFLAALAAIATGFVLQPVFAAPGGAPAPERPADRKALRLAERRQQLLLAIAEVDFERDAGKVGEEEHRTARAALLEEAAAVSEALDARAEPKGGGRRARRKHRPAAVTPAPGGEGSPE